MATGGPRRDTAARLPRRRPSRHPALTPALALAAGLALLTGVAATGCDSGPPGPTRAHGASGPPSASGASGGTTGRVSPAPSATAPEELCTRLVTHWARRALDTPTYGDYQSMGLSNGQYEILRTAVDAARAEKKHQGESAAIELIERQTRSACADRYRSGEPDKDPWR
ncbi:hypothetical protein [Streptomyces sp. NPDC002265]|uniref:hypothetical protein n=1 Tax=Streptomyces sp. NPDC002265 TaxID=3154415 RepID=UPI003333C43D